MTDPSKETKFDELVHGFDAAMLVTHDDAGDMHARPLSIASADAGGDLWFCTGAHSGKVAEMFHDRRVGVVMQGSSRYVSVTGTAEIVVDRAKAADLWSEAWRPWFPGGPNDPEIVLVHVRATQAEFWDLRGLAGVLYVFDAVKHALERERMSDGPSRHHDKVQLQRKDEPHPRSG
jgi:general stress protein 26